MPATIELRPARRSAWKHTNAKVSHQTAQRCLEACEPLRYGSHWCPLIVLPDGTIEVGEGFTEPNRRDDCERDARRMSEQRYGSVPLAACRGDVELVLYRLGSKRSMLRRYPSQVWDD